MPHNASPDLAAGSWSSMVGEAVVNERNARLAQPTGTIEDLRRVALVSASPGTSIAATYDVNAQRFVVQWCFPDGHSTMRVPLTFEELVQMYTPDAETMRKLHTIRAQSLAPVSFVDTPEPGAES